MRLEDSDAKYEIRYTPGDISSIKDALKEYRELIDSGKAFQYSYCVAHFFLNCEKLEISYFEGFLEQKKYLRSIGTLADKSNIQEELTGEALFFLCATIHPELEEDIKITCESIVAYSRKLNDSAKMWITCESPFGIEPLYITATVYPKYGYLLASFLIPYWDDEHMPESLYILGQWVENRGITDDTLKAFCYCDNYTAMENMQRYDTSYGEYSGFVSNFDLISHFRKNPEEYVKFKNLLVERYKNMPVLQSGGDYNENPIRDIVLSMLYVHYPYNTWDDDFDIDDYLTTHFVNKNADEEIEDIKKYIEEKLGDRIVPSQEEYREKLEEEITETDKWEQLIKETFDQGEELWKYIVIGINAEILKNTKQIDLLKKIREGDYYFSEEFEYVGNQKNFSKKMYELAIEYSKERRKKDFFLDKSSAKKETLRLIDVIFYSLDEAYILNSVVEDLEELEIATKHELSERYPVKLEKEILGLLEELSEMSDIFSYNRVKGLEIIYSLIAKDRKEAKECLEKYINLEAINFNEDIETILAKPAISEDVKVLLGTYIVYKDSVLELKDDLTKYMINYVDATLPNLVFKTMTSHFTWPNINNVKQVLESAIENTSSYQIEYRHKMLEGYKKWSPMEEYLKEGSFKGTFQEEAFTLALDYLKKNADIDRNKEYIAQNQKFYEMFFNDVTWLSGIAYFGGLTPSLKSFEMVKRFLKLSFKMAPLRMTCLLKDFIPDLKNYEDLNKLTEALKSLKKIGLPEPAYWIYQLNLLNKEIDMDEVDTKKISQEEDYVEYYVKLISLYFCGSSSIEFQDSELIYKYLKEGGNLIRERELVDIIRCSYDILGKNKFQQEILDEIALNIIRRSLEDNLQNRESYCSELLKVKGISFKKMEVKDWEEGSLEAFLECLKGFEIAYTERSKPKKEYLYDQDDYIIVIDKINNELIPIINEELFFDIVKSKEFKVRSCNIYIVDNCSEEYKQMISHIEEKDYKKYWMETFEGFIKDEVGIEEVRDIFKSAIYEYNFIRRDNYSEGDLRDFILELSPMVQNKILNIIGSINPEKLDLVDEREVEKLFDILISSRVEKKVIFDYLFYMDNQSLYHKYVKSVDCSEFIRTANITNMVRMLNLVGNFRQYHNLILELKSHKSLKVKKCVKELIEKHNIVKGKTSIFYLVDYGVYMADSSVYVSGDTPVTRKISSVTCIKNTQKIEGKVGMFIGLRFTSEDFKNKNIACHYSVTVRHPVRDGSGGIKYGESRWRQSVYNTSNIFVGWCFEDEEELISGKYEFLIHDFDDNFLVEKVLMII